MVSEKHIAGVMLFFLTLQLIFGAIFLASVFQNGNAGLEIDGGLATTGAVGFIALGLVNWALGHALFPEGYWGESDGE